ncbi:MULTISPECIES: YceI family protein [Kordiimonas]|jgi:polyisoprenoid-binding protein YceI|uniref:YceI family protein n=1 Tax=Kordiimonas TaxID=288021 RepID=UPI00257F4EE0|nr:YceI family protein [Kordiimonas sp. UBA4487]
MIRLIALIMGLTISLITLTPSAKADNWQIIAPESSLSFTATQAGSPFTGHFKQFDAAVTFDPASPEAAHIHAEIDLTSARTGADDRDAALMTPTWFNSEAFPKAVYEASGFTPVGDGRFETQGTLTLKGISQPLTLQFTLEITDDMAHVTGVAKIVRTNFNVGSGDFESGKWISKAVEVQLMLTAEKVPAGDAP